MPEISENYFCVKNWLKKSWKIIKKAFLMHIPAFLPQSVKNSDRQISKK